MAIPLIDHFRKFVPIDENDEQKILSFFDSRTIGKKENLIEQDTACRHHYFVVEGCLRMFFINEKGAEQTIQFALKNWWITDYLAFEQRAYSGYTIQAIEKSRVFQIDYPNQERLFDQFPHLERYFRMIYQKAYAALQFRTKLLFDFSREQLYHSFNRNFPEFSRRIPQRILASYLNMTPEYLSEIKKKSLS